MSQILSSAIKLAEVGVPIPPKTAVLWDKFQSRIKNCKQLKNLSNKEMAPLPGENIYSHKLAYSLKLIGLHGAEGFYTGKIAENIVKEIQSAGGVLTLEDMKEHLTYKTTNEWEEALFVNFHGLRI